MARSIGRVVFVSGNGGMIVVQSNEGFTVVELIGREGECPKGASVVADWTALDSETLFMGREEFDAYFQGTWGDVNHAVGLAREAGGG